MPRVNWSSDHVLGNAEIDDQHRRMVEIFNALHPVAGADPDAGAQDRLLDELICVTDSHFCSEEALMRLLPGWPQRFAAHLESHRVLLFELIKLREELSRSGACIGPRVLEFLGRWLFEHMDIFDRELAESEAQTREPVPWLQPDN